VMKVDFFDAASLRDSVVCFELNGMANNPPMAGSSQFTLVRP
jgi:hypothetical protein